jgi:hypothetical protein
LGSFHSRTYWLNETREREKERERKRERERKKEREKEREKEKNVLSIQSSSLESLSPWL